LDTAFEARALAIRKFNRFYTNIIGLVNQTVLDSPYSLAEVRVLLELLLAGEYTASDLTRKLAIDPGYLSRMLRHFHKEGLVTKRRSTDDRRVHKLTLTAKGRDTIEKLSAASTQQIAGLLKDLPDGDQARLVGHMEAIKDILSQRPENPPIIRPARPGDAGFIAHRHAVLYEKEYNLDKVFEQYVISGLSKFFDSGARGQIWVAEFAGRIVGSIAIVGVDAATAQLRWFLIEPEFRGSGLGRRLMNTVMDYCRQNKYRRVILWTFVGLDAARHLYESFGFRPTEQVENTTWRDKITEEKWEVALADSGG
jgi:DNA-binding MarR family transcriptional regulator/GNAT superfamily N-acetyltransferase